jgi:lipoyl-dependent peroxiredoxin
MAAMKRSASASWQGDLEHGKGTISTGSGLLDAAQYSFGTRFESGIGTNPEELIAAAHAGCFTMALSAALGRAGHAPDRVDTKAEVSLERVDGNWTIAKVHLDVSATVPGIEAAKFDEIAAQAKANCPVSRVLRAEITMTARLA